MLQWMKQRKKRIIIRTTFLVLGALLGWALYFAVYYIYPIFYYIDLATIGVLASASNNKVSAVYAGICMCIVVLLVCFLFRKFSRIDFSVEIFLIMALYAFRAYIDDAGSSGWFTDWYFSFWIGCMYMFGAVFFAAIRMPIYFIGLIASGKKSSPRASAFLIAALAELAVFAAALFLLPHEASEPSLATLAGALIGSANLALCFLLKKRLHFEPFFEIFIVMAMYAAGAHFYSIHSLADSAPAPAAQFAYCYIWALAFYLAARGAIKAASVIISDLRR